MTKTNNPSHGIEEIKETLLACVVKLYGKEQAEKIFAATEKVIDGGPDENTMESFYSAFNPGKEPR